MLCGTVGDDVLVCPALRADFLDWGNMCDARGYVVAALRQTE